MTCAADTQKAGLVWERVNSLSHDQLYVQSKMKAFRDDIINGSEKLKIALGRIENIVKKGENAGYQHFLLFSMFSIGSFLTISAISC